MLFGRWTYEKFYNVWHGRTDNPFTAVFERAQKYVASRTLSGPLPWVNSTLLEGDAADAVARLKQEPGPDLLVMGSGVLAESLMRRGLVDEYQLLIHPLVLGSGRRLFTDGVPTLRAQAREERADHHGRDHRHLPARRWRGAAGGVTLPTDTSAASAARRASDEAVSDQHLPAGRPTAAARGARAGDARDLRDQAGARGGGQLGVRRRAAPAEHGDGRAR